MGLFTKKQLSDAERQSWSAQLLEVREAELEKFGRNPTLGATWEEHDAEYARLLAVEYWPNYGITSYIVMEQDGYRPSGYRGFVEGEGMLMLADEIEQPPVDWSPGEVYWILNTREKDDQGDDIWLYQFVSAKWKYATRFMKDRVKEWDLENTRKNWPMYQDLWNRYYKLVALAIIAIVLVIVLWPIAAGVALGVALGETISVVGVAAAISSSTLLATAIQYSDVGLNLLGEPEVKSVFTDAPSLFNEDDSTATLEEEILSAPTAVFQPDGELLLTDNAPTSSPSTSTAFAPLALAAVGLLIFI